MLDEKNLTQLDASLKRIFAMKITRSTFRELQNVLIALAQGNKHLTNDLYESLITGNVKPGVAKDMAELQSITKQFMIPIRLSKEIFERGEFINIITSDTISQDKEIALLNRIRRIDGDEFLFITDIPSTVSILKHFYGRIQEFEKSEEGKKQLGAFKRDLASLGQALQQLASSLTEVRTV